MPSNPITPQEQYDILVNRSLTPRDGVTTDTYMAAGYILMPPATVDGPVKWRLFDAAYVQTGIIDPNRLGTGSTGAGNLYLADDGTWKTISVGGGGDMLKATYDVDNDGTVDSAERIEIIVRNSTGTTLTKGTVVYLSGATGNRPNALRAQANSEATSSKTFGFVVADINNNADGYVACNGTLHNLDTSAFADGVALWLSPSTAGGWTTTVPSEPNHSVFLGYVARSHPTAGRVVILIQNGYELNELHDVVAPSPTNNDLLRFNSSSGYWENQTISSIFGGTPLVSVPTLAQVTTAGNTTTNNITVGTLYFGNGNHYLVTDNSTYAMLSSNRTLQLATSGNPVLSVFTTQNVAIGTTTDAGYKLDVAGTARIAQSTAGTKFTVTGIDQEDVLLVNWGGTNSIGLGSNTANNPVLRLGVIRFTAHPNGGRLQLSGATGRFGTDTELKLYGSISGTATGTMVWLGSNSDFSAAAHNPTSGTLNVVGVLQKAGPLYAAFNPTSGNATFNIFNIDPVINTTGTYAGIVRGFYYNPTLTSVTGVTHRAIHTVTGDVLLGTTSGNVGIGTTTPFGKVDVKDGEIFVTTSTNANLRSRLTYQGLYVSRASDGTYPEQIISTSSAWEYSTRNSHTFYRDGTGFFQIGGINTASLNIPVSGNIVIGYVAENGYKLQVNGNASIKGSAGTTGLYADFGNSGSIVQIASHGSTDFTQIRIGNNFSLSRNGGGDPTIETTFGLGVVSTSLSLQTSTASPGKLWLRGNYGLGSAYLGANNSNGVTASTLYFQNSETPTAAQNVIATFNLWAISDNATAPSIPASSIFSLQSTTRGFLQPRMTNAQAVAITTPATGLQVYDTTNNKNLLYNGTAWQNIATETWVSAQGYLTSTPTLDQVVTAGNSVSNNGITITRASGATLTLNPGASDNAIVINNSGFIKFTSGADSFIRGNSTTFSVLDASYVSKVQFHWGGSASWINTGGNLLIGTTTDAGFRLDVNGTARTSQLHTFSQGTYLDALTTNYFYTADTGTGTYGGLALKNSINNYSALIYTGRSGANNSIVFEHLAYSGTPTAQGSQKFGLTWTTFGVGNNSAYGHTLTVHQRVGGSASYPLVITNQINTTNSGVGILMQTADSTAAVIVNHASIVSWKQNLTSPNVTSDMRFSTISDAANTLSEKMRISSAGNLLVGTTSDSGYKLDVNGTARISGALTINTSTLDAITFSNVGTSNSSYMRWLYNPDNTNNVKTFLYIHKTGLQNGSIYIAPTSQVGNATYAPTGNYNYVFGGGTSLTTGGTNVFIGRFAGTTVTTGSSNIFIGSGVGGSSVSTGSLNIGIAPEETLTGERNNVIYIGNIANGGVALDIDNAAVLGGMRINTLYVGAYKTTLPGSAYYSTNFTIASAGGSGTDIIGTSLTLAGGRGTGAGTPGNLIFSTAIVTTSGTTLQTLSERMRINGSGNVLINTTTDAGYKLDVNGTFRAQGSITATLASTSTASVVYYNSSTGLLTYGTAPIGAQFVIDYDYNIVGLKNGINLVFTTTANFQLTTTRVFLNGQRLTRGAGYDYVETGTNQITFTNAPNPTDLIIIEYQI